jgi:1-phosphatidylinositol phosphodiesterase
MKKWMDKIDENIKISELSIPGTHDSATFKFKSKVKILEGYIKTQSIDITEQLTIGIRFLDLRLKEDENGNFNMFHSFQFLNLSLDDVLDQVYEFLSNNETEFIYIMISNEGSKIDKHYFNKIFSNYIEKNDKFWYIENKIPLLKDVRGKIVLLNRYYDEGYGIDLNNWPDNTLSQTSNESLEFSFQDVYKVDKKLKKKFHLIKEFFKLIQDENKLYFNYLSGTNQKGWLGKGFPVNIAKIMNEKTLDYLDNIKSQKKIGIVIMDFPTTDLTQSIISFNSH